MRVGSLRRVLKWVAAASAGSSWSMQGAAAHLKRKLVLLWLTSKCKAAPAHTCSDRTHEHLSGYFALAGRPDALQLPLARARILTCAPTALFHSMPRTSDGGIRCSACPSFRLVAPSASATRGAVESRAPSPIGSSNQATMPVGSSKGGGFLLLRAPEGGGQGVRWQEQQRLSKGEGGLFIEGAIPRQVCGRSAVGAAVRDNGELKPLRLRLDGCSASPEVKGEGDLGA